MLEPSNHELKVVEGKGSEPTGEEHRRLPIPWGRIILVLLFGSAFAAATVQIITPLAERLVQSFGWNPEIQSVSLLLSRVAFGTMGFIAGLGVLTYSQRAFTKMGGGWTQLSSGDKVTAVLGILIGLVASVPFMFLLYTLLNGNVLSLMVSMIVLIIGFSTGSIYVFRSMDDILPWSRSHTKKRTGIKILDTNVIIDGRIYDVARSGFLEGPLYIPAFVINELQFIADSHDALRRQRGRRGLDVLRHLQSDFALEVGTYDRYAGSASDPVDSKLVRLARALGADIVTNDFNLNRVAALQDIRVLNLNDLSLALRPNVLPQETLTLLVSREGNQPHQGVGYLDDGTMVVVENGKRFLGETIGVVVTQVIQTERGKMIFAAPAGEDDDFEPPRNRTIGPRGRH